MEEQTVLCPFEGILFNHKRNEALTPATMWMIDQAKYVSLDSWLRLCPFPLITWFPHQASLTPESLSRQLWGKGIFELFLGFQEA